MQKQGASDAAIAQYLEAAAIPRGNRPPASGGAPSVVTSCDELASLKLSVLKRRARQAGVDAQKLEEADDEVDVKGTVIALIIATQQAAADSMASAGGESLPDAVVPLTVEALKPKTTDTTAQPADVKPTSVSVSDIVDLHAQKITATQLEGEIAATQLEVALRTAQLEGDVAFRTANLDAYTALTKSELEATQAELTAKREAKKAEAEAKKAEFGAECETIQAELGAKKAEAEAKKAEAKTKAMEVQLEAAKKMKEEKAKQKEMSRMMAALQTPSPKPCAKEGKTAEEVILNATPVSVKQSTEATDESTPEASYQSGSPPPSTGHTVQMMEQDAKALEEASAGSSIVSVPGSAPLHSVPAGGRTQSEQKLHEELEAVRSRSYALLSI
jgi:hypothetical protein